MMRSILFFIMALIIIGCKDTNSPFSQFEKATVPVVLGKGTLSKDSVQWNNVFVSKTKELYFTKMDESASVVHKMDFKEGTFQNLEAIPLPEGIPHSDIYLNEEGDMMLFSSIMPENENDTIMDWNIWKSYRKNGEWQPPKPFFENNLKGNQFYPWLTNNGNLYFAITPDGSGNSDLYVSELKEGKYVVPKSLPSYINSNKLEGDAFVSPDESYIIFAGFERGQNLGKSDLFISFNVKGTWSVPVWLGEDINSEGYDGSPFVTHDGNYLIFTSSRGSSDENTFFNHYIVRFDPEDYQNTSKTLDNYLKHVGKEPLRFDADNVSTVNIEYGSSFSTMTKEFYFTKMSDDFSTRIISSVEFTNGHFSYPTVLKIGGIVYKDASDAKLSANGEYLYFKMRGNHPRDSLRKDGNIWKSKRTNGEWGKAEILSQEINSNLSEFYPMPTNSGNLYFSRELENTSYDIFVSRFIDGKHEKAERLPNYINTEFLESDAYVAPDESFMIFARMHAEDGEGMSDLYISFNENDRWSVPKNMRSLNSKGVDGSPHVTDNGEYLFFTSTRDSDSPEIFDGHLDIYVVKFDVEEWKEVVNITD